MGNLFRITKIIFGLSLLMLSLTASGFTQTKTSIPQQKSSEEKQKKACQLSFGFTEWKPLQYRNSEGRLEGLQWELAEAVMTELGCKVTEVEGTWNTTLRGIKNGTIDFSANASVTPERQSFALFSIPYRRDQFTVFIDADKKQTMNATSIQQLKTNGYRLGLTKGYLYGGEIAQWQQDPTYNQQLSYADFAEENIRLLAKGNIDAFLDDPFIISYLKRSDRTAINVVPLTIRTFGEKVCFIFSKKTVTSDFVNSFNKALERIRRNPKYQSIWIDPYIK